jgi:hypothetical protein
MSHVNEGIFYGAYTMFALGFLVFDIAVGSWVAAIVMALLLAWSIYNIVRVHRDAKRRGVMTRTQHKLEERYEAELHSVWESK